jgi:hypothetical protein
VTRDDLIEISCTIVRDEESDMAILIDDGDNEVWLPRSQIEYETDKEGFTTVTLPEWLAMDKGLI